MKYKLNERSIDAVSKEAETRGWKDLLVTILNMAINLITEYFYDRYFVFGKTIDTNNKDRGAFEKT